MASALYVGRVRHRRRLPRDHAFSYALFMLYLDLDDLPGVFDRVPCFSARRPALAWFRRADYLGPANQPLDAAVRDRVEASTGERPDGPIRLLTHLRYFGYCMNPVSFYYCFAADGQTLKWIVAEINNTPWDERHAYVLPVSAAEKIGRAWAWRFGKAFHVSPFLPMDMDYDWRFDTPGEPLHVHMDSTREGLHNFDATLSMERRALTAASLNRALVSFPLITLKVATMIYWQALRLWLKRIPFHAHP
ncbi:MAG: DUF1365 domain-containing protein [Steroidobacteraceae bacterium]